MRVLTMHRLLINSDFLPHHENTNETETLHRVLRHRCDIFSSKLLRSVSLGTLHDSGYLGHQEECWVIVQIAFT